MHRTPYFSSISAASDAARAPPGSAEFSTTTKGLPISCSSRMTRSSASSSSARGISVTLPSVVTTTPTVEWSVMTLRVPISAASVMGISWSNHGVMTMRGARSSNCPTAPGTI